LKKLASLGLDAAVRAATEADAGRQGRGAVLRHHGTRRELAAGLQKALDEALARLPIPKVMTYQLADGWSTVNFVRPAHALVALHGAEVVPVSVLGLDAGRETQGHRFEALKHPLQIESADSYAAQMATKAR
jgi:glycyl-tRNA synthetase beta chain